MSRRLREQAILEVIDDSVVRNQAQLVEQLAQRGFAATQATVSRDIKRLGLIKRPARRGGYRYASALSLGAVPNSSRGELRHACEQFLTKIDTGSALLVLKTLSGRANALAVAIDECDVEGVVATLAGDDTVLLVLRESEDQAKLVQMFEQLAG